MAGNDGTHKQVIVVQAGLNMPPGKLAAQVAHASMGALLSVAQRTEAGRLIPHSEAIQPWLDGRFTKVVCQVKSEAELLKVRDKAAAAGLLHCLITDSGFTLFNGEPTITCLAIGPDQLDKIDAVTRRLRLL